MHIRYNLQFTLIWFLCIGFVYYIVLFSYMYTNCLIKNINEQLILLIEFMYDYCSIKMDKSWMGSYRNTETYIKGVAEFLKYAVRNYKISRNINPLDTKKKIENFMSTYKVCKTHISLN